MVPSSDPDIATGQALPPPPPPEAVRRRRLSPVWMAVTVIAGLLLVGLISSMFVYVPYYGIAPGDVRETVPLITSNDAELYDADGKLLYITVSVRRMTAFGAV